MSQFDEHIEVKGARVHNLKNIDVTIPREKLVVITGLSGSGKSSLAFDTIYAEGQRRYMETFSHYARQFIGNIERPEVEKIDGRLAGERIAESSKVRYRRLLTIDEKLTHSRGLKVRKPWKRDEDGEECDTLNEIIHGSSISKRNPSPRCIEPTNAAAWVKSGAIG